VVSVSFDDLIDSVGIIGNKNRDAHPSKASLSSSIVSVFDPSRPVLNAYAAGHLPVDR